MRRLSIIIPIYKAEGTIERCARSLMEQSMKDDIEFIFINDCTPDDSILVLNKVISEYPNRKNQVLLLNNECNVGPYGTRVRGINDANGEYVGFCDADDWIECDMFEKLYAATSDGIVDVVVSNYIEEREIGYKLFEIHSFDTPHKALANMHESHKFSWAMWNQIIRKDIIIDEIDKIYPTKFREDTFLMMRCYYKARSIAFVQEAFYHYNRMAPESISSHRNRSLDGWHEQKVNLDRIARLLYQEPEGYRKFHYGLNNFKFMVKDEFMNAFNTEKEYYYAFRECHRDTMKKYFNHSIMQGVKMWIYYCTTYHIFALYKMLSDFKEK